MRFALRLLLLASIATPSLPRAIQPVMVINFDEQARGASITREYWVDYGVGFPGGVGIDTAPTAHSGANVAHIYQGEFSSRPITIEFRAPRTAVRLFGGTNEPSSTIVTGTLKAFDVSGTVIAQDGPKSVISAACSTAFEVRSSTATIARVEFALVGAYAREPNRTFVPDVAIDDLVLEGPALPPLSSPPPNIAITSPLEGAVVDAATIQIDATAAGASLGFPATVTIDVLQPPDHQHHPPDSFQQALVQRSGRRGGVVQLGPPSISGSRSLPIGVVDITVEALNVDGIKGRRTIHVTNLPTALSTHAKTMGLGAPRWAVRGTDCSIAVYGSAALATSGNTAVTITGNIFGKWLTWVNTRYNQLVFPGKASDICPTGPDREVIRGPGVTVQDFRAGSIFSSDAGVFYVPKAFRDVIYRIGWDGVPIADPTRSITAETWLFQQFRRTPGELPITMEIKGSPPVLWVERQGGDGKALAGGSLSLSSTTATVWESAPCAAEEGPCGPFSVEMPPPPMPSVHACPLVSVTPEWVAKISDATMTPMMGFAAGSGTSDADNAATHELNYNYNIDGSYHAQGYWSDWDLSIVPFKPYWNLFGTDRGANITSVEVEFEYGRAAEMFALKAPVGETHEPKRGDLVFVSGRWIEDCGHSPVQTEIHPPFVLAYSRTQPGGRPRTVAYVWVNGWYLGEPFDLALFPPPRPSPTDTLVVDRSPDAMAAVDIELTWKSDHSFSTPVTLHFQSTTRRVPHLGDGVAGQLFYQGGRQYEGVWQLSWQPDSVHSVEHVGATWWP
jgi:hypothetical protein